MTQYQEIDSFDNELIRLEKTNDMFKEIYSGNLSSPQYSYQTTGWAITKGGNIDCRYLYVDQLHAKAFIADLEQALAGSQIICKSVAKVASLFGIPLGGQSNTLTVEEFAGFTGHVFVDGDLIRIRQMSRTSGNSLSIADAWGTVVYLSRDATKNPATQSYTFTRSVYPNAGAASGNIQTGTLALDYGTNDSGYYEVSAVDVLGSPYAQVVTWHTHPIATGVGDGLTIKARLGNLNGITTTTWGALSDYGFYGKRVYIEGDCYIRGALRFTNPNTIKDGAPLATTDLYNDAGWTGLEAYGSGSSFPSSPHTGDWYFWTGAEGTYHTNTWYRYGSGTWNSQGLLGTYIDGSGIYTGNIVCTQLTAGGTITGITIKTADSGARIEMNAAGTSLRFYDSTNYYSAEINLTGRSLTISAYGTLDLEGGNITINSTAPILEGDSRLSDARNAADVQAWAKASTDSAYAPAAKGVTESAGDYAGLYVAASSGGAVTTGLTYVNLQVGGGTVHKVLVKA